MDTNVKLQQIEHFQPNGFRPTSNILNYKNERDRYDTFIMWTKKFIDTKKLALYGFYLHQSPDIVKCAFCNVAIGNWELGDNVLREHLRWSPSCPLLNRCVTGNIPIDPMTFDAAIPKLPKNHILRMPPISRSDSEVETPSLVDLEDVETPLTNFLCHITSPDFRKITDRLESFKEWPKSLKQKPKMLSDAGFFYCGKGDSVKCFSCGGGLKDWEEDDDPWEQHALYYENCHYLNEVKSPQFIVETKRKLTNVTNEAPQNENTANVMKPSGTTETQDDLKMCQICFDEERCAIFFPCMHVIGCYQCSSSCDTCPICRSNITNIKRIYFS